MKIKPTGDRILLRIIKIQEQNVVKGVVIPEHITIGGSIGIGEIIGLGQGYLTEKIEDGKPVWDKLESKIGDRVIFNAKAGLPLSKKYRIIRESEIVANLSNDGTDIGNELLDGNSDI